MCACVCVPSTHLFYFQPVCQVPGISKCSGEAHHPNLVFRVGGNKVATRHYHFQDRAPLVSKEMDLINDQQTDGLHITPEEEVIYKDILRFTEIVYRDILGVRDSIWRYPEIYIDSNMYKPIYT